MRASPSVWCCREVGGRGTDAPQIRASSGRPPATPAGECSPAAPWVTPSDLAAHAVRRCCQGDVGARAKPLGKDGQEPRSGRSRRAPPPSPSWPALHGTCARARQKPAPGSQWGWGRRGTRGGRRRAPPRRWLGRCRTRRTSRPRRRRQAEVFLLRRRASECQRAEGHNVRERDLWPRAPGRPGRASPREATSARAAPGSAASEPQVCPSTYPPFLDMFRSSCHGRLGVPRATRATRWPPPRRRRPARPAAAPSPGPSSPGPEAPKQCKDPSLP